MTDDLLAAVRDRIVDRRAHRIADLRDPLPRLRPWAPGGAAPTGREEQPGPLDAVRTGTGAP